MEMVSPKGKSKKRKNEGDSSEHRKLKNREHAKKSRLRKKDYVSNMEALSKKLKSENLMFKKFITTHKGMPSTHIFKQPNDNFNLHEMFMNSLELELKDYYKNPTKPPKLIKGQESVIHKDLNLIEVLINSHQSFVISNPHLDDNPIIFCSDNFCDLTGYSKEEILGRNCRFLQGPETDKSVSSNIGAKIREGKESVSCLRNYKKDGTPFWNYLTVSPMKDARGDVVMCVGVQCESADFIKCP